MLPKSTPSRYRRLGLCVGCRDVSYGKNRIPRKDIGQCRWRDVAAPPQTPDQRTEHEHHDDLPLFTYRRLHLSLLDRLFYDAVGVGIPFPAIISSFMGRFPPNAATLLSRYPGIVSDLRTGLPEHQLLRPGRPRHGQLLFGPFQPGRVPRRDRVLLHGHLPVRFPAVR